MQEKVISQAVVDLLGPHGRGVSRDDQAIQCRLHFSAHGEKKSSLGVTGRAHKRGFRAWVERMDLQIDATDASNKGKQ